MGKEDVAHLYNGMLFDHITEYNKSDFHIDRLVMSMYRIFSCVVGHLGCVHVLAIVNRSVMNIGVYVSFFSYDFLREYAQWWGCCVIW